MPSLHLLGTGAAITAPHRTTSMIAVTNERSLFLIDCGGDVVHRVLSAGLSLSSFSGIILTHEHADHVSGFPLFMEKMWLCGRREPIPVYGPPTAINQARRCFETFDVSNWKGFPEIHWIEEPQLKLEDDSWIITTDWVEHSVPAIGVRIESKDSGGVVACSGDTKPVDTMVELAHNCDILVHDATGPGPGSHSSVVEAAQIATRANARRLILIHLPPELDETGFAEALTFYPNLQWAEEMSEHPF